MELQDAMRRIANRKVLIAAFVFVGCVLALSLTLTGDTTYTSSARLLISVPTSPEQGVIFADVARAIVTSPSRVEAALGRADVPPDVRPSHISVEPIGGSGALILSVSHQAPRVAARLANELAADLADEDLQPGATGGTTTSPTILDPPTVPTSPDPRPIIPNVVLGCLVGLITGVGAAAAAEVFSPGLVSAHEVARVMGVPALGEVSTPFDKLTAADVQPVATRLQLAARYAQVDVVDFFAESNEVALAPLIELLNFFLDYWEVERARDVDGLPVPRLAVVFGTTGNGQRSYMYFDDDPDLDHADNATASEGGRASDAAAEVDATTEGNQLTLDLPRTDPPATANGLVLVVRVPVRREGPELARDLLAASGRPILGVITYS